MNNLLLILSTGCKDREEQRINLQLESTQNQPVREQHSSTCFLSSRGKAKGRFRVPYWHWPCPEHLQLPVSVQIPVDLNCQQHNFNHIHKYAKIIVHLFPGLLIFSLKFHTHLSYVYACICASMYICGWVCMYVCRWVDACAVVLIWMSEDNLQKLFFSFHYVEFLGEINQIVRSLGYQV